MKNEGSVRIGNALLRICTTKQAKKRGGKNGENFISLCLYGKVLSFYHSIFIYCLTFLPSVISLIFFKGRSVLGLYGHSMFKGTLLTTARTAVVYL